jgi:hypothetical protein
MEDVLISDQLDCTDDAYWMELTGDFAFMQWLIIEQIKLDIAISNDLAQYSHENWVLSYRKYSFMPNIKTRLERAKKGRERS